LGLRLASERLLAVEAERERDARHLASAAVLAVRRELVPVDPVVRAAREDSADGSLPMIEALIVQMQAQASAEHRKNAVPDVQARAVDRLDGIPANA
jgi:hypothetical protein